MSTPTPHRATLGLGRSARGRLRRRRRSPGRLTALLTAGLSGTLAVAVALPVSAAGIPEADPELLQPPTVDWEVTSQILADSVTTFDPADSITRFSAEDSVEDLGETTGQEEDIIVLQADILFAAMEWDLPDNAAARLEGELAEVPEGAAVRVHGHTDSRPMPADHEVDNQGLSENRAQAVADAVAEVRPDLDLDVEGFGDTQPAVEETAGDQDTFAANRRVEIRYD